MRITFEFQDGYGEQNLNKETVEFEDDTTDDEIQEEFEEWVWQFIGDNVCWNKED